jgi:hypothetical protein
MEGEFTNAAGSMQDEVSHEIPKHLRHGHLMHEMDNYFHLLGGCFAGTTFFDMFDLHSKFFLNNILFLFVFFSFEISVNNSNHQIEYSLFYCILWNSLVFFIVSWLGFVEN